VTEALAWLGAYATLNLQIFPAYSPTLPAWFHWTTYALIWILPAAGLWLSIRHKDRLLLAASLVMTLATLITNKPVSRRHAEAVGSHPVGRIADRSRARRAQMARGPAPMGSRHGFTASRLLRSDRDTPDRAALASAAFHPCARSTTHGCPSARSL
jgi:hypothetical protein